MVCIDEVLRRIQTHCIAIVLRHDIVAGWILEMLLQAGPLLSAVKCDTLGFLVLRVLIHYCIVL